MLRPSLRGGRVDTEDATEDDAIVLGFQADQREKLGKAPAWAHHIHDCLHATNREVQRLRQNAAERETVVDGKFTRIEKKLDRIIDLTGDESDDGRGGQGLHGKINRVGSRVDTLESDRNRASGALWALGFAGTLMAGLVTWLSLEVWSNQKDAISTTKAQIEFNRTLSETNRSVIDRNTQRIEVLERDRGSR